MEENKKIDLSQEIVVDENEYKFNEEDYADIEGSDFYQQYGFPIYNRLRNVFTVMFLCVLFYPTLGWSRENIRKPTIKQTFVHFLNNWVKLYDQDEMEILGDTCWRYRKYMPTSSGERGDNFVNDRNDKLLGLKSVKMIMSIQGGMDRLEAFCDANKDLEIVQNYLNGNKSSTIKRKLMSMTAAICNHKIFLNLAKAMDAPIQIHYQGYKHQMIEILRDIAVNGKSEREKVNAADKLLTYLNPNQLTSLNLINVNLGMGEGTGKSIIESYKEGMSMLAKEKLALIKQGANKEEIINATILSETKENK